ncbi:hypothetical protein AC629_33965 [Bradyrhizobium sp. NAS80.1]|uniref:amidase n=1 Tax=Bradyrhizobium sp. NAS80.1 TaxID=1680159 RepID=UPI00095F4C18|nr:amidase [Bradyrhizobium sp. NAS80.1]OKO75509.1 hypothetical protein AC629_33965 [Bradyrhizobium sp. NAS80.1]
MSGALHHMTISDASRMVERKELSPVTLTEAFLARIEDVDPKLNAYITVTAARARDDARRAEREILAGNYKGPLHGIPVALKDIYDTAGIRTTCHSHVFADRVPERDSRVAEMLRGAGSVLLGKLATHEFAFAGPSWELPFPPARNPWNTEHFTGGSSSGSGAATAAGLAMATLGSDTAGSIRMPAFFCGVTGLKPTYGRVSRRGVVPLAYSLDHCGPLTWTARDAALVLQAIAGYDASDPTSAHHPVPDYASGLRSDLKGLRIGLIRHFYDGDEHATPEIKSAMDLSCRTFEELGATIEEVQLSSLQDYSDCCIILILSEALSIHQKTLKQVPEKYSSILRDRLMLSSFITAADYVNATRTRQKLVAEVNALFDSYDVLVTAGGLSPAPKIDQMDKFYLLKNPLITTPFCITGSPTIAVCNGFSAAGLPIGMQIAARAFDEQMVLRVADAYETATGWRDRRPPV